VKRYISSLVLLISFSALNAQYTMNLQFQYNGYSFSQEDNIILSIINSSGNLHKAYLYIEITSDLEGLIGRGYSRSFILNTGILQIDKTSNQLFDSTLVTYDRSFEEAYIRNGELPSRNYTVCISLFRSGTNQFLAKICETLRTQKFQPPINQFPFNKDTIRQENLNFQWIREQPFGKDFSYQVILVELLGKQTPNSAFATNNIFWKSTFNKIPAAIYPISTRPLRKDQTYAWLVEARSKELILRSEPTYFTVGEFDSKNTDIPRKNNSLNKIYTEIRFLKRDNQIIHAKEGIINMQYDAGVNEKKLLYEIHNYDGKILSSNTINLIEGLNLFEITLDNSIKKYAKKNLKLVFKDQYGNKSEITLFVSSK